VAFLTESRIPRTTALAANALRACQFFFQTYTYLDKSHEGRRNVSGVQGSQKILRGTMRARLQAVPIKDSIHRVRRYIREDGSTYKEGKENACVKH